LEKGPEAASTSSKRVVYGSRKKKSTVQRGPVAQDFAIQETLTDDENHNTPLAAADDLVSVISVSPDLPEDVKDEWDASTDEDTNQVVVREGPDKGSHALPVDTEVVAPLTPACPS